MAPPRKQFGPLAFIGNNVSRGVAGATAAARTASSRVAQASRDQRVPPKDVVVFDRSGRPVKPFAPKKRTPEKRVPPRQTVAGIFVPGQSGSGPRRFEPITRKNFAGVQLTDQQLDKYNRIRKAVFKASQAEPEDPGLTGVLGFLGRGAADIGSAIVGLPMLAVDAGRQAKDINIVASPAFNVLNPGAAEAASNRFKKRYSDYNTGVAQTYANFYGPLFRGDPKGFIRNVNEHPGQFALDAAGLVSGATGAIGAAGRAGSKAIIARSVRAAERGGQSAPAPSRAVRLAQDWITFSDRATTSAPSRQPRPGASIAVRRPKGSPPPPPGAQQPIARVGDIDIYASPRTRPGRIRDPRVVEAPTVSAAGEAMPDIPPVIVNRRPRGGNPITNAVLQRAERRGEAIREVLPGTSRQPIRMLEQRGLPSTPWARARSRQGTDAAYTRFEAYDRDMAEIMEPVRRAQSQIPASKVTSRGVEAPRDLADAAAWIRAKGLNAVGRGQKDRTWGRDALVEMWSREVKNLQLDAQEARGRGLRDTTRPTRQKIQQNIALLKNIPVEWLDPVTAPKWLNEYVNAVAEASSKTRARAVGSGMVEGKTAVANESRAQQVASGAIPLGERLGQYRELQSQATGLRRAYGRNIAEVARPRQSTAAKLRQTSAEKTHPDLPTAVSEHLSAVASLRKAFHGKTPGKSQIANLTAAVEKTNTKLRGIRDTLKSDAERAQFADEIDRLIAQSDSHLANHRQFARYARLRRRIGERAARIEMETVIPESPRYLEALRELARTTSRADLMRQSFNGMSGRTLIAEMERLGLLPADGVVPSTSKRAMADLTATPGMSAGDRARLGMVTQTVAENRFRTVGSEAEKLRAHAAKIEAKRTFDRERKRAIDAAWTRGSIPRDLQTGVYLTDIPGVRSGGGMFGRLSRSGRLSAPKVRQSKAVLLRSGNITMDPVQSLLRQAQDAADASVGSKHISDFLREQMAREGTGEPMVGKRAEEFAKNSRGLYTTKGLDALQDILGLADTTASRRLLAQLEGAVPRGEKPVFAVPTASLRAYESVTKAGRTPLDVATQVFKSGVLAFSPRWYFQNIVGQWGQFFLQAGPDLMAMQIARNPRFKKFVVPDRAAANRFSADVLTQGQKDAGVVSKNALQRITANLFEWNSRFESVPRNAALAAALKRGIRDNGISSGRILSQGEMLSAMEDLARAAGRGEKWANDIVAEAVRLSERFQGNYARYNAFERKTLKRFFPFYGWMRTITRLAIALPFRHPKRAALLAAAANISNQLYGIDEARALFGVPGVGLFGRYIGTGSINPFETVMSMFIDPIKGAAARREDPLQLLTTILRESWSQANPVLQIIPSSASNESALGIPFQLPPGYGGVYKSSFSDGARYDPYTGSAVPDEASIPLTTQAVNTLPLVRLVEQVLVGGRPTSTTTPWGAAWYAANRRPGEDRAKYVTKVPQGGRPLEGDALTYATSALFGAPFYIPNTDAALRRAKFNAKAYRDGKRKARKDSRKIERQGG